MAHPMLRSKPSNREDSLDFIGNNLAFQLLLELEMDDMAIGVVGEIERRVNHVAVDAKNWRVFLSQIFGVVSELLP